MSVPWLRFQPDQDAKVLHIDILVGKFIEIQPDTKEDADAMCRELYPVLDQLTQLCLDHGLKQVCSADFSDIRVRRIKPLIMMRIIWNIYEHTKNCILLENCRAIGGGEFLNTLVGAVRGLLPPFMRNMITLLPSQNQSDTCDENDDEWFEALAEESREIV